MPGLSNYKDRILGIQPQALVAYFPMKIERGTVLPDHSRQANHGTIASVTLGNTLSKAGMKCPLFDGSASYGDMYSAAFAADFSTTEGTVMAWARVLNNAVHADTTVRRVLTIAANATTNLVLIEKTATGNTFRLAYVAGSTTKSVSPTVYENLDYNTQWVHLALTYSVTADAVIVYVNGQKSGTTQSTLGTWSGSLDTALCVIGSSSTTAADVWSGWAADVAIWNIALSAYEIELASKVAG
jgi:hypothetical protein